MEEVLPQISGTVSCPQQVPPAPTSVNPAFPRMPSPNLRLAGSGAGDPCSQPLPPPGQGSSFSPRRTGPGDPHPSSLRSLFLLATLCIHRGAAFLAPWVLSPQRLSPSSVSSWPSAQATCSAGLPLPSLAHCQALPSLHPARPSTHQVLGGTRPPCKFSSGHPLLPRPRQLCSDQAFGV